MTVPGRRPQRLGEQIREEISGLLLTELKDPRIGFTTVTGVRVTPDLRQARVSVSVLGTADEQQRSLEGLRTAAAFIRRTLAHRLEVRRIPELEFTLDRTEERAARIDELLRQVKPADAGPEEKG